jgi:MFS transporter, FSR family, fosmidomycin resistance protein
MRRFDLKVLLLLSLGHMTVELGPGASPAILPCIAPGMMAGFAIGAGGIRVTLLGIVADHFGVNAALKSIAVLPVVAFIVSMMPRFAPEHNA